MIKLKNVTLVAVACTKVQETIAALTESMNGVRYYDSILITDADIDLTQKGIRVILIKKLDYKGYNHFILYRLKDYIKSNFCLLVQNDGYVLRPSKWRSTFLKYDYIGAPWQEKLHFTARGKEVRVGNGGFSLRSKKLLNAPTQLKLPFSDMRTGFFHEDGFISVYYREQLEKYGIKFAPVIVASKFSREVWCPDSEKYPFGFHKKYNIPFLFSFRNFFKKFGKDL